VDKCSRFGGNLLRLHCRSVRASLVRNHKPRVPFVLSDGSTLVGEWGGNRQQIAPLRDIDARFCIFPRGRRP
jgi:hypothetical protein